jgi:hypothetical protein
MSDKEGQKEPNNMKKNKETKEDKDPVSQKSLRQPTLSLTGTIQKKGRLGQLTNAMVNSMPIPSSTNNAAPAATSTPLTTGATWESNTNFQAEKSLSNISLAYTCSDGYGLQDDSMIRGGSPGSLQTSNWPTQQRPILSSKELELMKLTRQLYRTPPTSPSCPERG